MMKETLREVVDVPYKLDSESVHEFESEQRRYGTKTALYNVIWRIGSDLFRSIGVKHLKTLHRRAKK